MILYDYEKLDIKPVHISTSYDILYENIDYLIYKPFFRR